MISGYVNKKLKGSIVLPSISKTAKVAGDKIDCSEEQFQSKDIQKAWIDGNIIFKNVKKIKTVNIKNITTSSISLESHGIIKSGEIKSIKKEDIKLPLFQNLLKNKKISQDILAEVKEQNNKAIPYVPSKEDKLNNKNDKKIKRVGDSSSEDDIFVNGYEPCKDDDIIFVDIEQNDERIANHPILRNKKPK